MLHGSIQNNDAFHALLISFAGPSSLAPISSSVSLCFLFSRAFYRFAYAVDLRDYDSRHFLYYTCVYASVVLSL